MSVYYLYKSTDEIQQFNLTKSPKLIIKQLFYFMSADLKEILHNRQATTQLEDTLY